VFLVVQLNGHIECRGSYPLTLPPNKHAYDKIVEGEVNSMNFQKDTN